EEECQKIAGTPTCEGVQIGDTTGDGKEDPAEVLAYGFECTPENERDYIRTQASNSSPASCNDGETALIPLLAFLLTGDTSNLDTTQSARATGSTGRRGPLGSIAYNADVVCGGSAILLLQCWCVNYDDDSGIVSNSGH
ncbi:MAG: hypothetical protein KDD70_17235, partial [Bdellovibrionales bacterium]|nr:hypothetical protein [Bdellovibrionales bacterium]